MKVVLATDARAAGGVGRHIKDLAEGLMGAGLTVSLAAPGDSTVGRVATELGIAFMPFENGVERADVWHLHLADTYDRGSLGILAKSRLKSRRVVVTEHLPRSNAADASLSDDPRTRGAATAKTAFKRLQLGLAHSIIAVSHASRKFIISRYGLSSRRIVSIHNGIDLSRFAPPSDQPPTRAPTVVAVGSLIRQKGHDLLIRAAAASTSKWNIVVAGSGPQRAELERLADLVAPERVLFQGWVDDIAQLIWEAAVVCMPSRWESFAYVPLEAMALGRPVVASRVDGVDEVLTHGRSGLLVEPNDPVALAAAIDRLIEDAELANALGGTARRDITRFGLDSMIDQTVLHYRSLL
ncbi:glycosyltransferase family 4 protein [Actinoplanes sp. NPDC049548]|uniref:glycosyltransferase family 4 protein n=1 Tax=Actinoplanes sp. NPDC049548 TaxID=3155152 RepID=UPI00342DFF19